MNSHKYEEYQINKASYGDGVLILYTKNHALVFSEKETNKILKVLKKEVNDDKKKTIIRTGKKVDNNKPAETSGRH